MCAKRIVTLSLSFILVFLTACKERVSVKDAITNTVVSTYAQAGIEINREDVIPIAYYGNYGGAYVVSVSTWGEWESGMYLSEVRTCHFDDLDIEFGQFVPMVIKDSNIYYLDHSGWAIVTNAKGAYQEGILNKTHLKKIKRIQMYHYDDALSDAKKLDKVYIFI